MVNCGLQLMWLVLNQACAIQGSVTRSVIPTVTLVLSIQVLSGWVVAMVIFSVSHSVKGKDAHSGRSEPCSGASALSRQLANFPLVSVR